MFAILHKDNKTEKVGQLRYYLRNKNEKLCIIV